MLSVFSDLRPFCNYFNGRNMPINAFNGKTLHYLDFVKKYQPLKFMITLTVSKKVYIGQFCGYVNKYLHRHNRKLFGVKYYKKADFIKGFAFFEEHQSHMSNNDLHVHILVKDNERFSKLTFDEHEDIFRSAASRIVDDRERRIFNDKCIDIREVKDDGAIHYVFKQICDSSLSRIKFIGKGGLSDSL